MPACVWTQTPTSSFGAKCWSAMGGDADCAVAMSNLEVHHQQFRSRSGQDSEENLIALCSACHTNVHNP